MDNKKKAYLTPEIEYISITQDVVRTSDKGTSDIYDDGWQDGNVKG